MSYWAYFTIISRKIASAVLLDFDCNVCKALNNIGCGPSVKVNIIFAMLDHGQFNSIRSDTVYRVVQNRATCSKGKLVRLLVGNYFKHAG